MAPADAPVSAGTQLGLASGLLIAILVGAGTLYFRHYDLSRVRHASIRATLDARLEASASPAHAQPEPE